MQKISFVTGSRADYGIMRNYLKLLDSDDNIELSILVTGALLDDTFGHQVDLIYSDGFQISAEFKVPIDTSSNAKILHTMSIVQDKFAQYFEKTEIDLLIILGDRYEMLSVAIAAAMQRIPILHIHGGEATFGNYDEFIRHSISKMSLYHFTATEEYRKRVIQLGEEPKRVFYLGALGAENCLKIDETNVPDSIKELPEKKYFIVLFHPETLTNMDTATQIRELLLAINEYKEYQFVFLGTNADTNSGIIRKTVKTYVENHSNTKYYESLHTDAYHYLLKHGICLIGNSSSGIIEAPSLNVYTINIGDRQKGRVRGNSVIDTVCFHNSISNAINKVLHGNDGKLIFNPYYKCDTAKNYYLKTLQILTTLPQDINSPKVFYDIIN